MKFIFHNILTLNPIRTYEKLNANNLKNPHARKIWVFKFLLGFQINIVMGIYGNSYI